MLKEILNIIPKVSSGDLSKMEKSLSTRFGNIGKTFGKGIVGALAFGGALGVGAGMVTGLLERILAPIKEVQDAVNRTVNHADDVVTNAIQFGTTAGKLARLQALGQAHGLDAGAMSMLLNKFQTAVAQAGADPSKPSAVRQFVGQKDMVDAFLVFLQNRQKLGQEEKTLVDLDVFGEKQILKAADLFQAKIAEELAALGGPSSDKLTKDLNKLGNLGDLLMLNRARMALNDISTKAGKIGPGTIGLMSQSEQLGLNKENRNIGSAASLLKISNTMDGISNFIQDKLLSLVDMAVKGAPSVATDIKNIAKAVDEAATKKRNEDLKRYGGGKRPGEL